jgi:hypothetical protein
MEQIENFKYHVCIFFPLVTSSTYLPLRELFIAMRWVGSGSGSTQLDAPKWNTDSRIRIRKKSYGSGTLLSGTSNFQNLSEALYHRHTVGTYDAYGKISNHKLSPTRLN